MPVYNGQQHLAAALASHLDQTFEDFELIICDNASTDATQKICQDFAETDPRIRYLRNPENVGAIRNYELCFEQARGEFFTWSAHDDVCEPTFLAECVAALERDRTAVLAYSPAKITDGELRPVRQSPSHPELQARDRSTRFRHMSNLRTDLASTIFGLVRTSVLAEVLPHGRYAGADRVLVASLALRGPFVEVPPGLLSWRQHADQYSERYRSSHFATAFWDPSREGVVAFANWRRFRGFSQAVWSAPLSWTDRLKLQMELLRWGIRHRRRLAYDLVVVPPHRIRRALRGQNDASGPGWET